MESLFKDGKFSMWYEVNGVDKSNEACLTIKSLIVIKMKKQSSK